MTNIELFFLTLYTSSVTIISYKGYAQKKGWPIGRMFESDSSIIKIIGMLTLFGSAITAFFFIKWYWVFAGLFCGWLLSGMISAIFAKHTQITSLILFIISWIFLIIEF
jgi:hypothetical protein